MGDGPGPANALLNSRPAISALSIIITTSLICFNFINKLFRLVEIKFEFPKTLEIKCQHAFFVKRRIYALVFDIDIEIIFMAYIMDKL